MMHFNHLKHLLPAAALAVAVLAAASCGGGEIPKTRYYVLDLPPAPRPAESSAPATAVMMPVSAPRMLQQDRIVYREKRQEVGFYEYHRWAADPREQVGEALRQSLTAKGTFRSVAAYDGRTTADYIIRASIDRLEEVDYDGGVTAHAEVSAELVDAESRRVLWQGKASDSGAVASADVGEVVAKLSQAADSSVKKIAADIDAYVRQNLTTSSQ